MKAKTSAGQNSGQNCKEKKFQNLASSVPIGSENRDQPLYNPNVEKAQFGCGAEWTTQAAASKIINKGSTRPDTYKKKQYELSSQVFEMEKDYNEYIPMRKTQIDVNNMND